MMFPGKPLPDFGVGTGPAQIFQMPLRQRLQPHAFSLKCYLREVVRVALHFSGFLFSLPISTRRAAARSFETVSSRCDRSRVSITTSSSVALAGKSENVR